MCLCVHSVNYTKVVGSILVRQVCVCVWLTGFSWRLCDTLGVSEQQTKALPVVKDDYKRELYTVAHVSSPDPVLEGSIQAGICVLPGRQAFRREVGAQVQTLSTCRKPGLNQDLRDCIGLDTFTTDYKPTHSLWLDISSFHSNARSTRSVLWWEPCLHRCLKT